MNENDLRKARISDFDKTRFITQIRLLRQMMQNPINDDKVSLIINYFTEIIGFLPNFAFPIEFGNCFQRIVINRDITSGVNTRLTKYTQIKYPPKEVEKNLPYNRASLKGQAVFYAGYGELSVTLETLPRRGDLITKSKWKQKSGTKLIYFPIYFDEDLALMSEFENDWAKFMRFIKTIDANVAEVLKEMLGFMTEVFSKPIDKSDKRNYLISALFANYYLTNKNSNVQCLYYPSVPADYVTSNIACLPKTLDDYFDCVEVTEELITVEPNGIVHGWFGIQTAKAVEVNPSAIGDIKWQDEQNDEEIKKFKKEYFHP